MPPDGLSAADFENFSDADLQGWFDSEVTRSDGFQRLLDEVRTLGEGTDLGVLGITQPEPWLMTSKRVDPDLWEGFTTLINNAEIAGEFGRAKMDGLERTDWSFEWGRLSREQRLKFILGWNRDEPMEFADLPDDDLGSGTWLHFRGKPSKWLVVVPVVLFGVGAYFVGDVVVSDNDTDDADTAEVIDADADADADPGSGSDDGTDSKSDAAPADDTDTGAEGDADDNASAAAAAGTYEIAAKVAGPCGSYEVFLRMILFLNGQMTVDQLDFAGGNAFQSATGFWNAQMAVATLSQDALFEAWVFLINLTDVLSIYNVYGPSSPLVAPGSEVNLADYTSVNSSDRLDEVTGGGNEACSSELSDVVVEHSPFP